MSAFSDRAPVLLLILVGCGGCGGSEATPPATDSGAPIDSALADTSVEAEADGGEFCVIPQAVGGRCDLGATCPATDGCNQCSCYRLPAGSLGYNCTTRPCATP